jgi:hypothetical protein
MPDGLCSRILADVLQSIPAHSWVGFARGDAFFLANYNEATFRAEVIAIESGRVLREFLYNDHRHAPSGTRLRPDLPGRRL